MNNSVLIRLALFVFTLRYPPSSTFFPYTTLFRSCRAKRSARAAPPRNGPVARFPPSSQERLRTLPARSAPRCRRNRTARSEEHTSELQSHSDLVCRLLLEKKNNSTF